MLSSDSFAKNNGFSARKRSHQSRIYNKLLKNKSFHEFNVANRDLTPVEKLGKEIFEDLNLSAGKNQACNSCHNASASFADPDNTLAPDARPVSQGSGPTFFGGRNAPTATYAAFSPRLHWNTGDALFIGGIFWDGSASGQATTATATGPELGLCLFYAIVS